VYPQKLQQNVTITGLNFPIILSPPILAADTYRPTQTFPLPTAAEEKEPLLRAKNVSIGFAFHRLSFPLKSAEHGRSSLPNAFQLSSLTASLSPRYCLKRSDPQGRSPLLPPNAAEGVASLSSPLKTDGPSHLPPSPFSIPPSHDFFQQRIHLAQDLVILVPVKLDGLCRAFRSTDTAPVAHGLIDFAHP